MDEKKVIQRVTLTGVAGNIILTAFKLYAGIAGRSSAMVSDAVHSLSDVFATAIAFIGAVLSRKAPDRGHPYGHERFECLASLTLGLILTGTGLGIGLSGVKTILAGDYARLAVPGGIALAAAAVSIVTKEAMFWYTRYYARKIGSSAFMADAWHHRSDAMSSVGSLLGIAGARMGYPVLDSVACVIISLCILKVGFDILRDSVEKMLDTSCGEEFEDEVAGFISCLPGVAGLDVLRSRKFGEKVYIDAEISVDGNLRFRDAHEIAEQVHSAVEQRYPSIKHIMIHENPADVPVQCMAGKV